jgi:hypothetical protein
VSVRIEEWPDDAVDAMDAFFRKLKRREEASDAKYILWASPLVNAMLRALPFVDVAERGNCAWWTSRGLVVADLMRRPVLWPKSIFVDLFERMARDHPENVNVVSYRRVTGDPEYGVNATVLSGMAPGVGNSIDSFLYARLERFANVVVDVDVDTRVAHVTRRADDDIAKPNFFRHNWWQLLSTAIVGCASIAWLRRRRRLASPSPSPSSSRRASAGSDRDDMFIRFASLLVERDNIVKLRDRREYRGGGGHPGVKVRVGVRQLFAPLTLTCTPS